jgi:hypothetical protein
VELEAGDYSLEVREAGAAGVEAGSVDGMAGNETDGAGLNETVGADGGENATDGVGMDGNETNGGDGGPMAGEAGGDRGFRVQVLEDDITDPGDDTARVRLFHAVPDVDTVSISRIEDAEPGAGGGAGQNETDVGAGGEDPGQGEGDGVGAGQEDGGAGQEEGDGAGAGQTDGGAGAERDEGVRRATLSVDGNTVYSSFAVGYFDPEAAAAAGDDGGAPADAGNDSDGIGAGQEAGQNETGGDGEGIAEDPEGEEFELVTVEDAQGGERSDGGTGGLLDLAAAADD